MDCTKTQELLSEYIDGMLDNNISQEMERHFESCTKCRQEYKLLKSIVEKCHEFEEVDLPDNFNERLHERLIREKDNSIKHEHRTVWIQKHYRIAAVFLVMAISLGVAINSGIFGSKKKSGSAPENASYMVKEMLPSADAGDMSKASGSADAADPNITGFTAEKSAELNLSMADQSANEHCNIFINISEDEYKKLYEDIVVEIEGMQGYLVQKEPAVFEMPRVNKDAFISKLNNNYSIYNISASVVDITEEKSKLQSEISELEEKKGKTGPEKNEGPGSTEDIEGQIVKKMDELRILDNSTDFITIYININ